MRKPCPPRVARPRQLGEAPDAGCTVLATRDGHSPVHAEREIEDGVGVPLALGAADEGSIPRVPESQAPVTSSAHKERLPRDPAEGDHAVVPVFDLRQIDFQKYRQGHQNLQR